MNFIRIVILLFIVPSNVSSNEDCSVGKVHFIIFITFCVCPVLVMKCYVLSCTFMYFEKPQQQLLKLSMDAGLNGVNVQPLVEVEQDPEQENASQGWQRDCVV